MLSSYILIWITLKFSDYKATDKLQLTDHGSCNKAVFSLKYVSCVSSSYRRSFLLYC